ncbi:MFS transporter [Endozoicomonas montiporae]|uniref:Proline/betaine transporter n=1 Tax=Endozoicomonas montiporae CL-33 TaxID=570277 RepID=A0A142BFA8_9GAMM|nr:MFS transporter [Endozoicomonas montiporae]AMO57434.1 proline/betaine transporter [Endozoicomonas montiporae CL-33]
MSQQHARRCVNVPEEQFRLAFAISLGGMLEMYDFMVYAMMASYIAESFFPSSDPMTSLLGTFATFAVGYLSRPLGGFFFGHLGDRYGRKSTFTLTISIMALTTALIGCMPTYDSIGILAPALLVLLRLFQGFSLGGELPGAMTYVSETTPGRSGLVIGILFMSFTLGFSLATFVHGLLTLILSPEAMSGWGWRVPFWVGGLLGGLSYYIRLRFDESGLFMALNLVRQRQMIPMLELVRKHRRGFFCGFGIAAVCGSAVTLLGAYMPGYLTTLHGFSRAEVAWHSSLAYIMFAPLCLLMGLVTDRCSHKKLLFCSIVLIAGVCLPYYQYVSSHEAELSRIMMVAAILSSFVIGTLPPMLVRLFPSEVRYTGVATSYNLGMALFGGLAPVSITPLIKAYGLALGPALYLIIISLVTLLILFITWPDYSATMVGEDQ